MTGKQLGAWCSGEGRGFGAGREGKLGCMCVALAFPPSLVPSLALLLACRFKAAANFQRVSFPLLYSPPLPLRASRVPLPPRNRKRAECSVGRALTVVLPISGLDALDDDAHPRLPTCTCEIPFSLSLPPSRISFPLLPSVFCGPLAWRLPR